MAHRSFKPSSNHQAGYTLLELIVVMVVLGLLAAVATPQLLKVLGGAKNNAADLQMDALANSLSYYAIDVGSLPTTDQGLEALWARPEDASGWNGPYVQKTAQLRDPWGRQYVYRIANTPSGFELASLGADGVPGGDGDNQDIAYAQDN